MHAPKSVLVALTATLFGMAQATTIELDFVSGRSAEVQDEAIEGAVRRFTSNLEILTNRERAVMARAGKPVPLLSTPVRVLLRNAPARPTLRGASNINLSFETSGNRAFDPAYRTLLQSVFTSVQSRLNLNFGLPSEGGTVWVRNYDADMGDREAVSGGIYIHNNGLGDREIRFPVYADGIGIKPEVAAINFVHTLLLAYMGSRRLPWDGWDEGLARAVTARVCRTPGALPGTLDSEAVEGVLQGSYDIGGLYDWNNQRALSGPVFIAPNLRNTPLPVGGSVGGLYLLRYLMAGSSWQKVLVEYPTFAASFLPAYYANTSAYQSVAQLAALGQTTLGGLGGSQIEGKSFASWVNDQFILNPTLTPGLKLQVQPFPIFDGLAGNDFGVFAIQAHHFQTLPNGDESLLRATSYPIYWSPDFTRFFASAQDDRIDIVQAYGNVVPNFPGSPFGGEPYRVTVDVPVEDQLERISLPAGAIATATNPTPSNFYGTITGVQTATNQSFSVEVQYGSTIQTLPVRNFAFGSSIADTAFEGSLPLTLRVRRTTTGGTTTIFTRRVNKAPGSLGVVLDVDPRTSFDLNLATGIQMVGVPINPESLRWDAALDEPANAVQASRWNPLTAAFEFSPNTGQLRSGHGYFVRREAASTLTISGRQPSRQPISVALRQGWNLVCNPLPESINRNSLTFVTESNFPQDFPEALGTVVGPDIFRFVPGAADVVTGFPEVGNFSSVSGLGTGEAFFIKVLSPTGTTLVFAGSDAPGRSPISTLASPTVQSWTMRAALTSAVDGADVVFGQSTGATASFDRKFDIEVPPGSTGLGLKLGNGLYRDTRAWGNPATYQLSLSNLKVGRSYTLTLTPETTRMTRYRFRDPVRRYTRDLSGTTSYTFTANARTRSMSIETVRPR